MDEVGKSSQQFADVSNLHYRLFYQTRDVRLDVLQRERSNLPLDLELRLYVLPEFRKRYFRQIVFVAQEVVNHEHAFTLNRLLDRFVTTEGVVFEKERKNLR